MSLLGIKIPREVGRLLSSIDVPGEKCDLSDLHITLLCFENEMSINKIAKAMIAAFEVTENEKPFTVKMDHVSSFPKGPEGIPIMVPISSKELFSFREKLAKSFSKEKIKFRDNFEFNPHVTLSYSEEKPEKIKFDKLEFGIQEIVLWGGEKGDQKIFITFPFNLGISKVKKTSSKLNDAILFASNHFLNKTTE